MIKLLMAERRELVSSGADDAALPKFRQVLARNPFHAAATEGVVEASEKLAHDKLARYYRRLADNLQENP